jgi:hypothetical protein
MVERRARTAEIAPPRQQKDGVVARQFTILIPMACVGMLCSSAGVAAPDAVPKLNTAVSCESHGRKTMVHHGNSNRSIEACKASENEAHQELVKHWSRYAKSDKTSCHGKVTSGGPPSYIELHSCLETMRHAREIRGAHHVANQKQPFRTKPTGQE